MAQNFLVPVKPFDTGKSRLSSFLTNGDRRSLNMHLFRHTIAEIIRSKPPSSAVYVVTSCNEISNWSIERGYTVVPERGVTCLSSAVEIGERAVRHRSQGWICYVPTDLPLLSWPYLEALLGRTSREDAALLVPGAREVTTSVMTWHTDDNMQFCFGPGSLIAHIKSFLEIDREFLLARSRSLELDLDRIEDVPEVIDALEILQSKSQIGPEQLEILKILKTL